MRRISTLVASVGAAAVLGGLVTPVASASTTTAPATESVTVEPTGYDRCKPNRFCLFLGWNGDGKICQWRKSRVSNTADKCPRFGERDVKSVWNRRAHRIQYYTQTNCNPDSRVGSTVSGGRGSLQGDYQVRSFQRNSASGTCGL